MWLKPTRTWTRAELAKAPLESVTGDLPVMIDRPTGEATRSERPKSILSEDIPDGIEIIVGEIDGIVLV